MMVNIFMDRGYMGVQVVLPIGGVAAEAAVEFHASMHRRDVCVQVVPAPGLVAALPAGMVMVNWLA